MPTFNSDHVAEVTAALSRTVIFSSLKPVDLDPLVASAKVVSLCSNDILWTEGGAAEHVGVVLSGRLKMTRQRSGREVIVDVVGTHDVVGEVAAAAGAPYPFDVRCLRRARVAIVPVVAFRTVEAKYPQVAKGMATVLAEHVLRLTRHIEALSAGSVEHRLAQMLVELAERFGEPFPGGTLLPVHLRREDLAALAATTLGPATK
ncbi:MAG: Crp/Fnr family transcriptional regulator [Myxococcaceae bacterium]|nr:Crp/Fnr family transcriptional regulator [Myxococcaceae bacterium]